MGDSLTETLTKDDIKKSVEYRWRMGRVKTLLIFMLATFFVSIIAGTFIYFSVDSSEMGFMFLFPVIIVGLYIILAAPYMVYCLIKVNRLMGHYSDFQMYEVTLNNRKPKILGADILGYTVSIFVKYRNVDVETNAIFSDNILSEFTLKDYDKKKVYVLYDELKNKVYVMCKC